MADEFTSGALGAIAGAAVSFILGQRSLRTANVVAERTKWRDKIRGLAKELHGSSNSGEVDVLWRELALNLNPLDDEDKKLHALARQDSKTPNQQNELTERFALLLKHDWDRAKIESSWFPLFASRRAQRRKVVLESVSRGHPSSP